MPGLTTIRTTPPAIGANKPMQPKFRKQFDWIFQFKIEIKGSIPSIWRRIEVPDTFDFMDLHHAIQDAMHGWLDCHLHNYTFPNGLVIENTEEPLLTGLPQPTLETGTKLKDHFHTIGNSCVYLYDYGDDWEHEITLENISVKEYGKIYPRIIDGERACPIEDAGGMEGYMEKLEVLQNQDHEEYNNLSNWVHRLTGTQRDGQSDFDPEYFDKEKVKFTLTTSIGSFIDAHEATVSSPIHTF